MTNKIISCALAALLVGGHTKVFAQSGDRKLLDPANMNRSVKPGDNFYQYANGAWLKSNAIPPSETRWGSFNELQENNYNMLRSVLEAASTAGEDRTTDREPNAMIGNFYLSGMDSAAINKNGMKPLAAHLARIDAIKDINGLLNEIGLEHRMGLAPVFNFYIAPDDKDVNTMAVQVVQGGLGMPDRDYYLKDDARYQTVREQYRNHIANMYRLMGVDPQQSQRAIEDVLRLERMMADASMSRVDMRDPYRVYNKMPMDALTTMARGTSRDHADLNVLLRALKVDRQPFAIVGQPAFLQRVFTAMQPEQLPAWKNYLKYHLVNSMAPYLDDKAADAHFGFYGTTLRGQQAQKPRWKRVLNVIDGSIGDLLGQQYVAKYFRPEARTRMTELVQNLQTTYADRIQRLDWMSAVTKKEAIGKLNTFMRKIGYPDKWKDYGKLQIRRDDYVANIMAASEMQYDYELSKLGRPVDRTEWGMTPPTVNAYYNPAFNEIVFPAGILQYPFFDASADDAVNYGGIGAVIGHEMTHGFDDQGRQYDATGNLRDWWTAQDADRFKEKADLVVKQYNGYTVLDTVHVNGELTLGENLADLGGLAIAYEAFQKTKQAKDAKSVDGFTPNQRFFLSWAQVWRANIRDAEQANRIVTDPHSPGEFRCNGPLTNMPAFYEAFNVKPGDNMYREPKQRVMVW